MGILNIGGLYMITFVAKSKMKPISLNYRQIRVKWYNDGTRKTCCEVVNVTLSTEYKNRQIYRCSQKCYYVFEKGEWQYFGTLIEAKRFIDSLY